MKRNVGRVVIVIVIAIVIWAGVGVVGAQSACAHDPRFACSPRGADRAVAIPDPAKSWAYYGRLAPGQTDTYAFDVKQQIGVPISLLVEAGDIANPARPSVVIARDGTMAATIDFERNEKFHEPFSGLDYLTTPDHRYVLGPGHYTATVSISDGAGPQRYVFAIGEEEKFGFGEIPYVLGAVYRVKTRGY